jgi:hypothetical protein
MVGLAQALISRPGLSTVPDQFRNDQAFAISASQTASVAAAIAAGKAPALIHIGATAFLGVLAVSYGIPIARGPAGDKAVLRWIDRAGRAHAASIVFTTGSAG